MPAIMTLLVAFNTVTNTAQIVNPQEPIVKVMPYEVEAVEKVKSFVPKEEPVVTPPTQEEVVVEIMLEIANRYKTVLSQEDAYKYYELTRKSAQDYGHDPLWIIAMEWQESHFNTKCTSSANARGVLQLLPSTAKYYDVTANELYVPEINIPTGVRYFTYLRNLYDGDLRMATIAYNQGEGNVRRGTYRTWYYKEVSEKYNILKAKINEKYSNYR